MKVGKDKYPIQTVGFASTVEIDQEPAFCWWVQQCLRNHDVIVASVNWRISKTSHKYGIKVPVSITRAIDLDLRNKDTHWQDAINKEIRNKYVAIEILDDSQLIPIG